MNIYKTKKEVSKLMFYILFACLAIVFLSPFIVMLTTSFKTLDDAFTVPVKILPRDWIFTNYGVMHSPYQ